MDNIINLLIVLLFIARGYIPHGRGEIINILREHSSQVVIMHKLELCETMFNSKIDTRVRYNRIRNHYNRNN